MNTEPHQIEDLEVPAADADAVAGGIKPKVKKPKVPKTPKLQQEPPNPR